MTDKTEVVEDAEKKQEAVETSVEEPQVEEAKVEETVEEKKDASTEEDASSKEGPESTSEESKEQTEEKSEEPKKSEKKKGLDEPSISKEEYQELRAEVKDIGARKEWLFEVRSVISKEIKLLFNELKKLKESRDDLTSSVKVLKDDREKINAEIKEAISKIKGSQKVDGDSAKVNVGRLKKDLEKLQYHIETTPLSPENEKKIMKQIKEKEKIISKAKDAWSAKTETKGLSKEINVLKDKSNEIHDKVQANAKESQVKHENMISVSKEIKFLKAREKEIHQLFSDIKDKYKDKRRLLMQNRKFYAQPRKKPQKAASQKEIMKKVEENIEEKIKKGQKITTEDLLNFKG
jgi:uncharacterized coiled-coil DUF342 family protein